MAAKEKPSDDSEKPSKDKDSSGGKKPHPWNVDCDGVELMKDKKFMDEATKIVNSLRQFGYRNPEVHVISYKVGKTNAMAWNRAPVWLCHLELQSIHRSLTLNPHGSVSRYSSNERNSL